MTNVLKINSKSVTEYMKSKSMFRLDLLTSGRMITGVSSSETCSSRRSHKNLLAEATTSLWAVNCPSEHWKTTSVKSSWSRHRRVTDIRYVLCPAKTTGGLVVTTSEALIWEIMFDLSEAIRVTKSQPRAKITPFSVNYSGKRSMRLLQNWTEFVWAVNFDCGFFALRISR